MRIPIKQRTPSALHCFLSYWVTPRCLVTASQLNTLNLPREN
jgi:hypothetical protein